MDKDTTKRNSAGTKRNSAGKNTTLDLHATLAIEIKAAKKAMFKRHREGMPLREAADKFHVDMAARFHDVVPDHDPPLTPAEFAATAVTGREKLAQALSEILHNPQTPVALYNSVGDLTLQMCMPLLDYSPEIIEKALPRDGVLRESSSGTASVDRQADHVEPETRHTADILTDKQVDYAISKMMEISRCGPNSGMAALIKHFRDLDVTGRAEEAKEDAEKWLGALAREGFEKESRASFLEDMKIDTGSNDDDE